MRPQEIIAIALGSSIAQAEKLSRELSSSKHSKQKQLASRHHTANTEKRKQRKSKKKARKRSRKK